MLTDGFVVKLVFPTFLLHKNRKSFKTRHKYDNLKIVNLKLALVDVMLFRQQFLNVLPYNRYDALIDVMLCLKYSRLKYFKFYQSYIHFQHRI